MRSIVRVAPDERVEGQPTPGMVREQAVQTEGMWAGFARTDAGMVSGWHHHGAYESSIYVLTGSLRMEFGPDGAESFDAGPGDFVFVGKGVDAPRGQSVGRSRRRSWWSVRGRASRSSTSTGPSRPAPGTSEGPRILAARDRARRGASGALYPRSASAGLNPRPRPARSGAPRHGASKVGSHATPEREPGQVRKEAALSVNRRVPWASPAGAPLSGSGRVSRRRRRVHGHTFCRDEGQGAR